MLMQYVSIFIMCYHLEFRFQSEVSRNNLEASQRDMMTTYTINHWLGNSMS